MPFILLYWKQILIGILLVALLGAGYWFKSVLAERDAQRIQIGQMKQDISSVTALNNELTNALTVKQLELKKYAKLINKLASEKETIQNEYDAYMKEVENAKPKITPGIGITEPYILLTPGMSAKPSDSKRPNNP